MAGTRRWWLSFVLVLALLGGLELALRQPSVRDLLPPRTHYYHQSVTTRLDALEDVLRNHGRLDVLFVGSSIVYTDIRPLAFDAAVRPRAGDVVSFNAGMAGMWPIGVHLYLEHLWLPAARPAVVVQGIRFPELTVPTHAKNETQVWTGTVEAAWRPASRQQRLHAWLAKRVALLQYRGTLTSALAAYAAGRPGSGDEGEDAIRGWHPRPPVPGQPASTTEPDLPIAGTCAQRACETGLAALRRSIQATRQAGAEFILVNIPEHGIRWRIPDGVRRYRDYVQTLHEFAASEGITFVDPTDGDPYLFEEDRFFFDLSHLSPSGASQLTDALARELAPALEAWLPLAPREAVRLIEAAPLDGLN